MSEKIYNMVKNSEKKDGKDCFTIVEKMLAKIQKPSSKLYYDWVYKEFLRHLTDGYYYTALLFLQEATKSSLYNIKDIASELRSIYFLNKVLEGEKSLSKEFFYYLVENEKDAEKIADLFNRYAALTNASGTSSIRKFLDAVLNAHKNRTDNLYDRFLMFKEVTQIAQNSYVHQNFIEDFLFKLCTHVNFHIDNDRRKYALFFTLMGYDLSSLRPAMFYQYFLRAFKTMYGSRTKNEFDLLDNFYQNMQSYGMKSWVVWELLDSYISLMKKERMFEKDLYLQALESENFQELHNFLTKYGWPEETIVSKIAGNILNLYIEHADWAQTKFLIHILSDEYLKNLKNSNTSFNRSNLKTINLTRGQIFSILHKRFDESEDFSKTLDALYELKRLFPISFNEFSKNSESVRKQYRDNEDNQNFKDFIYPFLIYLKEKSYRCPEITNKVQAFELIHVLERLHLTDYKRISQRRQAELLLFHLFHINDINKWYQFWSLLPTKTSQADIFFGLLRQYYWHMNGRFVMKQGNEAAENFNNVLIPIIDEAKSMLTPAEYYFIDMFAIISVIKTMGQSDRIHPEQLTDLLEYKPIAHQSKEELFKGLEFAIKMVSELSKNNTYFSLTECIKFAMKHPLVKQTASRPDFWYKIKFSIINKILGRDISGVPLELYELFKNNQMHIVTKQLDGILRKTIEEKEILEHYIYNADTSVFNVGDLKNDGLAPKKKFDDLVEELRLDASKKKLFPRYEDVLEE
uniref:Uncharacterized protein n=1 Tax=Acrobeloides nanus TaxID=290746 RepID=A0A914ECK6_9BILA